MKKEIITFSGTALFAFHIAEIKKHPEKISPDFPEIHHHQMNIPTGVKVYGDINFSYGQHNNKKADCFLITQFE